MNAQNLPDFKAIFTPGRLRLAWEKVRRNEGCSGGDNITWQMFEKSARTALPTLAGKLVNGTYAPGPLRLHEIPKDNGETRQLAIPSIADRVAQTALTQALVPVFEERFHPDSYGYRPGRSVQMAVDRVHGLRALGYTHVVEADIDRAFDSFAHETILSAIAPLGLDPGISNLVALWLEHFGLELGTPGRGLAQGSPMSPLLANAVLDGLDDKMDEHGFRIVRFADDFLIMTRAAEDADRALLSAQAWLQERGLRMNADGSRIVSFDKGFAFLGKLFVMGMSFDAPDDSDQTTRTVMRDLAEDDMRDARDRAAGHDATARVLYVTEPGRSLRMANRSFVVESALGEPLVRLGHTRVARIELGPDARIEHETMRHVLRTGTELAFVDGRGETAGVLSDTPGHQALLHLAQAKLALEPDRAADMARRLVEGRIRNQRARLRVLARKDEAELVAKAAVELGRLLRKLPGAADVAALRGYEGRATAVYLPALAALCPGEPAPFRRSRPAQSPLNASMNYLSALLERDMHSAVLAAGLHPGLGVLHSVQDRAAACVWDLMEGFRALLGEGLPVALFRRKRLRHDMFEAGTACVVISQEGRHALIKGYEAAIARKVTSGHSGHKVGLRRLMLEEARAFAAHARDPATRPFQAHRQDY